RACAAAERERACVAGANSCRLCEKSIQQSAISIQPARGVLKHIALQSTLNQSASLVPRARSFTAEAVQDDASVRYAWLAVLMANCQVLVYRKIFFIRNSRFAGRSARRRIR